MLFSQVCFLWLKIDIFRLCQSIRKRECPQGIQGIEIIQLDIVQGIRIGIYHAATRVGETGDAKNRAMPARQKKIFLQESLLRNAQGRVRDLLSSSNNFENFSTGGTSNITLIRQVRLCRPWPFSHLDAIAHYRLPRAPCGTQSSVKKNTQSL